jgi:hypothetical protein
LRIVRDSHSRLYPVPADTPEAVEASISEAFEPTVKIPLCGAD